MAETTVSMDDKELFDAATADETPAVAEAAPQEAASEPKADAGPARDEHGRFAPKAEEPAKAEASEAQAQPVEEKPAPQAQPDNAAQVPSWRLAEVSEARRQAEARAAQAEAAARRYEAELRRLSEQPKEPIDPYADPEKFRDAGVRQAIDPIQGRMSALTEHYSRENAIRVHGEETVVQAYKWLEAATHAGDPKVQPLLQRVTSSIDPFADVVKAYKHDKALSTVGDDPEKWFQQELEKRKADPAFVAQFAPAPQQNGQSAQASPIVKLPPSLTRASGAAGAAAQGTMNDADLYAYAKG